MELTLRVWEYSVNNPDGFSLDLQTFKPIRFGIAVGFKETLKCHGLAGLEKVIDHALKHDKKVGGWLDLETEYYFFDSIRIFSDLEEAIEFGRLNNQEAIFDLTNLREIRIN